MERVPRRLLGNRGPAGGRTGVLRMDYCSQPRAFLHSLTPRDVSGLTSPRVRPLEEARRKQPAGGLGTKSFTPSGPATSLRPVTAPERSCQGPFPGWSHNSRHQSACPAQQYFPGLRCYPWAVGGLPRESGLPTRTTPRRRRGSQSSRSHAFPPRRLGSPGRPKCLPLPIS